MPQPRDKHGRFLKTKKEPSGPVKKKQPRKIRGKGGKYTTFANSLDWHGGGARKAVIMSRWNNVKDLLDGNSPPGMSADGMLVVFSGLSKDASFVIHVTFLFMPKYGGTLAGDHSPTMEETEPREAVLIGYGMDLITKISGWINTGYIIESIEWSELTADAFKPVDTKTLPLWQGDSVETIDGTVYGVGDPNDHRFQGMRRKKMNQPTQKRSPEEIRRKNKRAREMFKLKQQAHFQATGEKLKRNKGNVAEQRKRARLRKKQKEQEKQNEIFRQ